ncbi:uncharacterized protein SRS1_16461 [Sporisorium reilianum f. sp. reilianum]|uniref:Secreted protein n=1 Tax=Sporisorium reilianum f. sp. reilianum TaxID=72559 RepID=A0A2N8UM66_9BASI|nr:uncharacterized protein SRS1_16461 [Sporisorium reilianum f. sp. reilianum]
MPIWFLVVAVAAIAFPCVMSAPTNATNVDDNHRLFSGKMPHPSVFGLTGYVPLSSVGEHADADMQTYPDMANAEGTGSFVDYSWKLHGIPSYLYTSLKLSSADLERNNYRIEESREVRSDSDAVGGCGQYKVVRTGARVLEKRLECRGPDTPPAPADAPRVACHTNHASTLEDCAPLYFMMIQDNNYCNEYDQDGRTGAVYRSCGLVSKRGRTGNTCISYAAIALDALPIIDQCWPRDGPFPCTSWHSGVIESTNDRPKTCACNNGSVGKC